jgi:hypothetical protein
VSRFDQLVERATEAVLQSYETASDDETERLVREDVKVALQAVWDALPVEYAVQRERFGHLVEEFVGPEEKVDPWLATVPEGKKPLVWKVRRIRTEWERVDEPDS